MAKKKAAKKVAKKAAVKKAVKKSAEKTSAKKVAKKAAKNKKVAKKTAKKAVKKVAKKAVKEAAKKAPAKKAAKKAAKKSVKKVTGSQNSGPPVNKKIVKKSSKNVSDKKEEEEIQPPIVIKKYVKPDVPAKLSPFEKKQKQKLMELRDQLMDTMYGMQQDTKNAADSGSDASGSGMHQGDAGSDAYDRDFALNLLSQEHDALEEIEGALQRLDLGTYGVCEISKEKIPKARLEAIPFARLTVECQSRWEEENGHRRFQQGEAFGFN